MNAWKRRASPAGGDGSGGFVVGFRLDGDTTHRAVGELPPQTPLDARTFPPWAALLDRKRAHAAVTRHRASVADALLCPDKRLHPHLCNCGKPRERVATPKTDRRKRRRARQKQLVKQHIAGNTDTFGRVEVAKNVYLSPGIWAQKKAPHYISPHADIKLEGLALPMAVAAVRIQKIWRGTRGRLKFRREYWKQGMNRLAKSFDTWRGIVNYKISLRRLASARFIQRNVRALWQWRINRRIFVERARRICVLRKINFTMKRKKIFSAWKWQTSILLHHRKCALTLFHLRRHAALNKMFRTTQQYILRTTMVDTWWQKYVVVFCRQREMRARYTIAFKRWLKFCYDNNALRTRRMRIMFRAWTLYTKHQIYASMQRQRIWASGIIQREWRCFLKKRDYQRAVASIALINRFFRGTLARAEASRRRRKRYELSVLRAHVFSWQKVTTLWRKERVYRENVTARLMERGISEKIESWSEVTSHGFEAAYLSQFPSAIQARPFPVVGAHVVAEDSNVKAWRPPLEWAVDRKDLLRRRRIALERKRKQRMMRRRIEKMKHVVDVSSGMVIAGSGFVLGRMRRAWEKFSGKRTASTDISKEGITEGETMEKENEEDPITTEDLNSPPPRLTRTRALRAAADMASKGYLEVLKWLRDNGCEWNEDVCAEAAQSGHMNVLRWAHQNGCPADERVAESAAETGRQDMLLWAIKNSLPRSVPMLVLMASRGHQLETLNFLAATQPGFSVHPMSATAAVLSSQFIGKDGDEIIAEKYPLRDLLAWLFEHMESVQVFTEETAAASVRRGRLELLKWLRHMNCPWDWRVLAACKQFRQKHILEWIMKHGGGRIKATRPKKLSGSFF